MENVKVHSKSLGPEVPTMPRAEPDLQACHNTMGYKRQAVSLETKKELCDYKEKNPTATHEQMKELFGIASRKTVTDILGKRDKYIKAAKQAASDQLKKLRKCGYPEIDKAVKLWFIQARTNHVTDALITDKALAFAESLGINTVNKKDFAASNGWLSRFKQRHGIKSYQLHGKAEGAPIQDLTAFCTTLQEVQEVTKDYNLKDIFNCDETGLFFCKAPTKTLGKAPGKGSRKDKATITILLTCNALGTEKLKPLVIGTAAKPRCYQNVDMHSLPHVDYFSNKKAWMQSEIFKQYMLGLNAKFKQENRKILLLLDNAAPHDVEEYDDQLTHVKVHYLPPNTMSHLQPADAGVITNFKVKYKVRYIKHLLKEYECNGSNPLSGDNKFNICQAIDAVVESWNDVKPSTILHCWAKTGILSKCDSDVDISSIMDTEADLVQDIKTVSTLLAQIPQDDIHQTMDATTYLDLDNKLPILETLTDKEIIAKAKVVESESVDAVKEHESADEEPAATWTELEDATAILLASLQGKAMAFPLAEDMGQILRQYRDFVTARKFEPTA